MNFFRKHKKKIYLLMSLSLLVVLSGCGLEYAKDEAGKIITDPETGAKIIENMIDSSVSVWQLIKEGNLWDALLVVPLSRLIQILGNIFGYGLGIIFATFIVRFAMYPITQKSTVQAEKMKAVQPKIEKINAKYRGKDDKESKMKMNQEVLALYQKEGINPLKGCITPFLTLPLFIAFYSAIYRTPGILNASFLGLDLDKTPSYSLGTGQYGVIVLTVLIAVTTYISMKASTASAGDNPQTKHMPIIFTVMISFFSFTLPAGLALYWIAGNVVTYTQTMITRKRKLSK